MTVKITATVTSYEGDDFPEAAHYADFVRSYLEEQFPGAEVDVSEGSKNTLWINGKHDADGARELGMSLWDAFTEHGYKAWS